MATASIYNAPSGLYDKKMDFTEKLQIPFKTLLYSLDLPILLKGLVGKKTPLYHNEKPIKTVDRNYNSDETSTSAELIKKATHESNKEQTSWTESLKEEKKAKEVSIGSIL